MLLPEIINYFEFSTLGNGISSIFKSFANFLERQTGNHLTYLYILIRFQVHIYFSDKLTIIRSARRQTHLAI